MKKFSELEKKYLKSIVDLSGSKDNNIGNLFFWSFNYPVEFELNYEKSKVEINYYEEDFESKNDLINITRTVSHELFLIIKLLKFLEKKDLIYFFKETSRHFDKNIVYIKRGATIYSSTGEKKLKNLISQNIEDENLIEDLLHFNRRSLVVDKTLISFLKNGFLTDFELLALNEKEISIKNLKIANQNFITAKRTLIVSIIALIFTVLFQFVGYIFSDNNNCCEEIISNSKERLEIEKETLKQINSIHYDIHKDSIK